MQDASQATTDPTKPTSDGLLTTNPTGIEAAAKANQPPGQEPNLSITLCLSGGGFRATLFHIGVLLALRQLDVLKNVRTLVGVSGGAVAGAHAFSWWDTYKDTAAKADKPLRCIRHLCMRGVQERIVQQLVLQWPFYVKVKATCRWIICKLNLARDEKRGLWSLPISTRLLMKQLRKCLQKKHRKWSFEQIAKENNPEGKPALFTLASDVKNIQVYAFGDDGLTTITPPGGNEKCQKFAVPIPADFALAASSAFPGAIQPIRLKQYGHHWTNEEISRLSPELLDGGVIDNLGTMSAQQLAHAPVLTISSTAENAFRTESPTGEAGCVGNRLAALGRVFELSSRQKANGVNPSLITIGLARRPRDLIKWQEVLCNRLADTRTSFDAFGEEELYALINMGHYSAMRDIKKFCEDNKGLPFSLNLLRHLPDLAHGSWQADPSIGKSDANTIHNLASGRGAFARLATFPMALVCLLLVLATFAAIAIARNASHLVAWSNRSESKALLEREAGKAISNHKFKKTYTVVAADSNAAVTRGELTIFFNEEVVGGIGFVTVKKASTTLAEQNVTVFGLWKSVPAAQMTDGIMPASKKHNYWDSTQSTVVIESLPKLLTNVHSAAENAIKSINAEKSNSSAGQAPKQPTPPDLNSNDSSSALSQVLSEGNRAALKSIINDRERRLCLVVNLGTNMEQSTMGTLWSAIRLDWLFPWSSRISDCRQLLAILVPVSAGSEKMNADQLPVEFVGVLVRSDISDAAGNDSIGDASFIHLKASSLDNK